MPIPVSCPTCGSKLRAPDHAAGKKSKCPKCGSAVPLPVPAIDVEPVQESAEPEVIDVLPADPFVFQPPAVPMHRSGPRHADELLVVHEHYHQGRIVHHHRGEKSGGIAAILEVLPGLFGVFGIGHMYAGHVLLGLFFMFGFWFVTFVNVLLIFACGVGFVTGPICWVGALILSPILAAAHCSSR